MKTDSIPKLDISRFATDRGNFVAEFGSAYREWGFAGITDHGIDTNVISEALQAAEAFFAISEIEKKKYISEGNAGRGYIPFGVEKAKGARHSDLKEFYHIGRDLPRAAHLSPNIWPTDLPRFRAAFETIYRALDDLAAQVLEVMALYLELPIDYFDHRINEGEALLRVLHYPPILDEKIPNLRAAEHEDINLITLLAGSEQEGLEVLSRRGEWIPISMIKGTIICNVGDMMQRLTNGKIPSTTHRVVNPKGEKARASRYSIPFFVHPNPDVPLDCLPQCVDEQNPVQYEPITAEDFRQQRLREIGLV